MIIPLGKWTLLLRVMDVSKTDTSDYRTHIYLQHLNLPVETMLDLAKSNKLFCTNNCYIIEGMVSTTYDTIHDISINTKPETPVSSERIADDIEYISNFCTHNQH